MRSRQTSAPHRRYTALITVHQHATPATKATIAADALDAATAIPREYARAEALTGVAAQLPPDQQPAMLARALDAASAISDEYARARALTGLAAQLPPDQLGRAMSAGSGDSEIAVAILARSKYAHSTSKDFLALLRLSLVGNNDRRYCLSIIIGATSGINEIGGSDSVVTCAEAIRDVASWWQ